MKKIANVLAIALAVVMLVCMTACGGAGKSAKFSEVLAGKDFATYHWYFNEKNGDSGFFTDDNYYSWHFEDAENFTVAAKDGSFAAAGTIEWTSDNQGDVYLDLGQYWTAEFSYSSENPDFVNFMIQETNFVYVLEPVA